MDTAKWAMIPPFITFNKIFYEMPNEILIFFLWKIDYSVHKARRWKIEMDIRRKMFFSPRFILSPYTKGRFVAWFIKKLIKVFNYCFRNIYSHQKRIQTGWLWNNRKSNKKIIYFKKSGFKDLLSFFFSFKFGQSKNSVENNKRPMLKILTTKTW